MRIFAYLLFTFSSVSFAGPWVVGNGGDIVAGNPVTIQEIRKTIPNLRIHVISWFHGKENDLQILEVINEMKIHFHSNSPCPAIQGHRDGSVLSVHPPIICISGFSLREKLSRENLVSQLSGLIIHEVAHLLGANEDQAVLEQMTYLQSPVIKRHENLVQSYNEAILTFQSLLYGIKKTGHFYVFDDSVLELSSELTAKVSSFHLSSEDVDIFIDLIHRLNIVRYYPNAFRFSFTTTHRAPEIISALRGIQDRAEYIKKRLEQDIKTGFQVEIID